MTTNARNKTKHFGTNRKEAVNFSQGLIWIASVARNAPVNQMQEFTSTKSRLRGLSTEVWERVVKEFKSTTPTFLQAITARTESDVIGLAHAS